MGRSSPRRSGAISAGKLRGGDDSHGAPPGVHFLLLPVFLFPSSLFALRALPDAWQARREPVTRFLLAWIIPSWAVFELVPTKLPHYTLPLYPALFLLAARWTLNLRRDDGPRWFVRLTGITLVIAAGIVGLGAAALPVFIRPGLGWTALLGLPALAAAVVIGWLVLRALRIEDWPRAAWTGLLTVPLLYWAILAIELPNLPSLWIAPRVAAALDAHWPEGRPPGAVFGAAGFHEPSLMFLCGTDTRWLASGGDAARFLAATPDAAVAIADRDLTAFETESRKLGVRPRVFAAAEGYNYSRGRRVTLTLFAR